MDALGYLAGGSASMKARSSRNTSASCDRKT
jgi:hypothetical protein